MQASVAAGSKSCALRGAYLCCRASHMLFEPFACELGYVLERARIFEEMRCAAHDLETMLASQLGCGFAIERNDLTIEAAYDEHARRLAKLYEKLGA